jgi:hypothetical protein
MFVLDLRSRAAGAAGEEYVRARIMIEEVFLYELGRLESGARIADAMLIEIVYAIGCDTQEVGKEVLP